MVILSFECNKLKLQYNLLLELKDGLNKVSSIIKIILF